MNENIAKVNSACGASGYVPQGATERARILDACAHINANSAPSGEEALWEEAKAACREIEAFFAGR